MLRENVASSHTVGSGRTLLGFPGLGACGLPQGCSGPRLDASDLYHMTHTANIGISEHSGVRGSN